MVEWRTGGMEPLIEDNGVKIDSINPITSSESIGIFLKSFQSEKKIGIATDQAYVQQHIRNGLQIEIYCISKHTIGIKYPQFFFSFIKNIHKMLMRIFGVGEVQIILIFKINSETICDDVLKASSRRRKKERMTKRKLRVILICMLPFLFVQIRVRVVFCSACCKFNGRLFCVIALWGDGDCCREMPTND